MPANAVKKNLQLMAPIYNTGNFRKCKVNFIKHLQVKTKCKIRLKLFLHFTHYRRFPCIFSLDNPSYFRKTVIHFIQCAYREE